MVLQAVKITPHVWWVGAIDWTVRNFHGYSTDRGTTYNAYLIMAEKVTLIDTVKHGFEHEMFERISSVIDISKIDYIVSNHSEPDHSGGLPEAVKRIKPAKVFASTNGVKALAAHFGDMGTEITAVKDGESLSLGNLTLQFTETRMLHWPDSMFSYLLEEQVLFSQDAFGMHLASSERFDKELPWDLLKRMAQDYYANIITLYSPQVAKLLERVEKSGLSPRIVAPDHGPIWLDMEQFGQLLSLYKRWSSRQLTRKAVIVYDTMWHSTEYMARAIEDGMLKAGIKVETMPLASCSRSDVASEMIDAAALIVGAPTLNNNLYPSVADVLTYLRGLKFMTPYAAAFGSYGWSGESVKQIREYFATMETEVIGEIKTQYVPTETVKQACFDLGVKIANAVKEKIR